VIHKDNREFIAALEKTRDVVRIKDEVDWELEAGAIVRRTNELKGPSVLFEKLKGYSSEYRIFATPLASLRRISTAMGLPVDTPHKLIQEEYGERVSKPIKPVAVKNAPCKEVVMTGDDVDLYRFPAPYIHTGDGGRYMCTWHLVATRDPETKWMNYGMYRAMIHDQRTLGDLILDYQHQGYMYYNKYLPHNMPMPFAIAIGCDPLTSMVAAAFFRKGEAESDFSGGLHKSPLEVVKCETNDLMVPANAEIVIEGEVAIDRLIPEGPFGEYTGYRHPERRFLPPYMVKTITHRKNPILTMSNMGMPVDDSAVCLSITTGNAIKRFLKVRGITVQDVHSPIETVGFSAIISVKITEPGLPEKIANTFRDRALASKIFIVDDDIDPFNLAEVVQAFSSKCHPANGVKVIQAPFTNPLNPYLSHEDRKKNYEPLDILDCTWPYEWSREKDVPPRSGFNDIYPEDIRKKVLKNWDKYGLK